MKKYGEFINESKQDEIYMYDILSADLPIDKIKELKNIVIQSVDEQLNESLFSGLWNQFQEKLSRRVWKWLINRNERELTKKLKYLNMVDVSDLSDCFKPVSKIYLGGGIDKAPVGEDDWRTYIEKYFGGTSEGHYVVNGDNPHVVYSPDIINLSKTGYLNESKYEKPILLNPLRNEVVRDNEEFQRLYTIWKTGQMDDMVASEEFQKLGDFFNRNVVAYDLRVLNVCDTNLVKFDKVSGAGTLGELQMTPMRQINMFMWIQSTDFDQGEKRVQDISPWLMGSVTKLIKGDENLKILLDAIKKQNQ